MSLYNDFETRIRQDLADSSQPPLLAATDIDRHVDHAVRDLALVAPLDVLLTVPLVSGQRTIDLTSTLTGVQLIRLEAVEWPVGQFPQEFVQFNLFGDVDPQLTLLVEQAPDFTLPGQNQPIHQSDFEDGSLQNWSSSDGIAIVGNDTAYAYSGTHSLAVTADQTGSGAIDSPDLLSPSVGYLASVWLWGALGRAYTLNAFRTDTQGIYATTTVVGTGAWQFVSIRWMGNASINVRCQVLDSGSGPFPTFFIDLFTLESVEESAQAFANLYCKVAPQVTSSSATSSLPPKYDDVVALGAAGYAAQELAARLMNLPTASGGEVVSAHYSALSEKLLADFGTELGLLAQRNQFFVKRLYHPEYPPQGISQTEVYPPGDWGWWP